MYEAEQDPYCYPDSDVLKNKAGLRKPDALERFETAMTFKRADEPLPSGRLSATHYRNIHHHLFQDVYNWAGQYRTVRMSKGGNSFCYPEHISAEMTKLFQELRNQGFLKELPRADFVKQASHFIAELNAIHPFREGNGRTQLTLLALLSDHAEHPIDLDRLDPDQTLQAMIASFHGREQPLRAWLSELIPE